MTNNYQHDQVFAKWCEDMDNTDWKEVLVRFPGCQRPYRVPVAMAVKTNLNPNDSDLADYVFGGGIGMNYPNLLHEVGVSKSLAQFRDGFIRLPGFPSHRLPPPLSKLSLGLTVPPQAEPPVPCGCNYLVCSLLYLAINYKTSGTYRGYRIF